MAREHIVDLDERYLDQMERDIENGFSYLGAYGRAQFEQNDDDNFAQSVGEQFFDGSGLPPHLASRNDHNSDHDEG